MSTVDFEITRRPTGDGSKQPIAVLGGGPAGLTAGYLLAKQGRPVIVFEAEDQVGHADHQVDALVHRLREVVLVLQTGGRFDGVASGRARLHRPRADQDHGQDDQREQEL